ncbi:unnamed protein product [Rotaria sordida]|uniref:Uncharacterized protein n=1 Tax=Rotaria sordida TaxID=392033 RepID=A0A815L3W7_9BILA|nr:unnamed protein product [Rotaria sordida]CAF1404824.1 unnamed protein product [Rotaria sordida]CAF4018787.1 unnamed protein product [Rotaria sordida]CAF4035178.1 unnamed protein product [Rotaria sordida]
MEETHLLPLHSLTQEIEIESDSSISLDDEVIENVIQMLDNLIDLSDITNGLQDNEEDDDQQQAEIVISISSMIDTTTNLITATKNLSKILLQNVDLKLFKKN